MKGFVIFISLLFAVVSQAWAHAEKVFCLKGKLGAATIAVKMISYDETPSIRYVQYFFSNDKRDRYMAGKQVGGFWHFSATVQPIHYYPKAEGSLSIAPHGPHWQGTWMDNNGIKQAVLLTPIEEDALQFSKLPQIHAMDPYEKYRLGLLHFTKNSIERGKNGWQTDWYIEKESGISFFRLGKGGGANSGPVNTALEAVHLWLLQQYFAWSPQKKYAKPETRLLYLTGELVSFRTTLASRFLGLTTTQVQLAATLDVATGATLKLEEVLWLDRTTEKPADSDFFAMYQYRKKIFAPRIFQWLQQLYPAKMKTQSCGINTPESWKLPAWNLTAKGLALGINSTDDCGTFQWAIIPYQWLQPFVVKQYHL